MNSLRSLNEKTLPSLQVVDIFCPWATFAFRHITLSLQRCGHFWNRCLILSRNTDSFSRFKIIENVLSWSQLPLLLSFPSQYGPSPQIWFIEPPSFPVFLLCPPILICLHLCSRNTCIDLWLPLSFIPYLDFLSLVVFQPGYLLKSRWGPFKNNSWTSHLVFAYYCSGIGPGI